VTLLTDLMTLSTDDAQSHFPNTWEEEEHAAENLLQDFNITTRLSMHDTVLQIVDSFLEALVKTIPAQFRKKDLNINMGGGMKFTKHTIRQLCGENNVLYQANSQVTGCEKLKGIFSQDFRFVEEFNNRTGGNGKGAGWNSFHVPLEDVSLDAYFTLLLAAFNLRLDFLPPMALTGTAVWTLYRKDSESPKLRVISLNGEPLGSLLK
jgi:hypothetical protein